MCFAVAVILIGSFVPKVAAEDKKAKPLQISPTPTPIPTPPPVVFTASPIASIGEISTPVPEPSLSPVPETSSEVVSMAILLLGILGAAAAVRRRVRPRDSVIGLTPSDHRSRRRYERSIELAESERVADEIFVTATPQEADEVRCTVFAPHEAGPNDAFLVQAFAHLAEQAPSLWPIAKQADQASTDRGSQKLGIIERGQQLGFYLEMPGLEVDEPQQSLLWNGEIAPVMFGVIIPATFEPRSINCKLTVSRLNVPVGHIRFNFKISAAPGTGEIDLRTHQNYFTYRLAFISYASPDRSEVMKRVQMLDLAKVKYFQDLLSLEAGKQWEPMVYRYIDECDVFYLFWSSAAKKSKWVRKEVQRALKRKGHNPELPPEIMPIPIEGPPPVKPPRYLADIQFDSKFLYFINPKDNNN